MSISLWSVLAVPALVVIFLTALFGLNDVHVRDIRKLGKRGGMVEMALGASFLVTALMTFTIGAACVLGANVYTWRGCLLMYGISGIFGLVGRFAPWRNWIRRIAEVEVEAEAAPQ
jgi:hypothetical protein